jgi:hypothetical protein
MYDLAKTDLAELTARIKMLRAERDAVPRYLSMMCSAKSEEELTKLHQKYQESLGVLRDLDLRISSAEAHIVRHERLETLKGKDVLRAAISKLEKYQRLLDELNSKGKYQYVDEHPKDILATRDELVRVMEGME